MFEKAKINEVRKLMSIKRQILNYFNGYVKRMPPEQGVFLGQKQNFVCGNVLYSLNKLGAFKVMANGQVEHSAVTVQSMQFKMFEEPKTLDESPLDFWERLLADPVSLLPSREKQELSFSSPVFVPI